jgi:hypothetical protein
MNRNNSGRYLWKVIPAIVAVIIGLIAFAYLRTLNRTELEFRIGMNADLIQVSAYGEPPTFAIWLENSRGELENIFVTHRAYENDWEGKPGVPVALPLWFHLKETGSFSGENNFLQTDAVTGATPREDLFAIRVEVRPDSIYFCWIEMNLSGDYNEFYKENDPAKRTTDEYGNGQPALIFKGSIKSIPGQKMVPAILGMTLPADTSRKIIHPVSGVTTASQVFSTIEVEAVRPKPYLLKFK